MSGSALPRFAAVLLPFCGEDFASNLWDSNIEAWLFFYGVG